MLLLLERRFKSALGQGDLTAKKQSQACERPMFILEPVHERGQGNQIEDRMKQIQVHQGKC